MNASYYCLLSKDFFRAQKTELWDKTVPRTQEKNKTVRPSLHRKKKLPSFHATITGDGLLMKRGLLYWWEGWLGCQGTANYEEWSRPSLNLYHVPFHVLTWPTESSPYACHTKFPIRLKGMSRGGKFRRRNKKGERQAYRKEGWPGRSHLISSDPATWTGSPPGSFSDRAWSDSFLWK